MSTRGLYIPLPAAALDELRRLSDRNLRGTREQAAYLILEGLKRHRAAATAATPEASAGPRAER